MSLIAALGCCALRTDLSASDATSYDLSRDFSIASNPNGVWSYGWESTLNGAFTLLSMSRTFVDRGVLLEELSPGVPAYPLVQHNTSTNLTYDNGELTYPPGTISILAGFDGTPQNFCAMRFTVPPNSGGTFVLENVIENRQYGSLSRDTQYHVVVNGVEILGTNLPPNSKAGYTNTLALKAGDTVDLAVGRGSGGIWDSGLKVQARFTMSVCTPHKAKAVAQVVNGFVVGATITDPGCGYTNPPIVLIQGGGGTGAAAQAVVSDGRVPAIQFTDAGCCYTNSPRIVISSPPMEPSVEIKVSKINVVQNAVLGWRYVLESSTNNADWTATGPAFTAETDPIETEFPVDAVGRFFRLRVVP
jgi:hypothetical protein